jgi:dienelactone hydrolase
VISQHRRSTPASAASARARSISRSLSFHKPAPGTVKAKVLVCHGAADSLVPDADVANLKAEMEHARADFRFIAYPNALHGFTNPDADAKAKQYGIPLGYDAGVDAQSWKDMQEFLTRAFA